MVMSHSDVSVVRRDADWSVMLYSHAHFGRDSSLTDSRPALAELCRGEPVTAESTRTDPTQSSHRICE